MACRIVPVFAAALLIAGTAYAQEAQQGAGRVEISAFSGGMTDRSASSSISAWSSGSVMLARYPPT